MSLCFSGCLLYEVATLAGRANTNQVHQMPVGSLTPNEGAGSVVNDDSGNGNDGALSGASWTSGNWGVALDYGSNSSHVVDVTPMKNYLNGLSAFSVSVWVKADAIGTDRGIAIDQIPTVVM